MVVYIEGMLTIANVLISFFVFFFAISFLKKTTDAKDRSPWVFLLIAVMVFFALQVIKVLGLVGILTLANYSYYFDSMFIAIILFTFVFQYNLILNSELILISKKTLPKEPKYVKDAKAKLKTKK